MVHSTINFGTSTPISRHKKRLDRQFSLYQTYAFNMVPLVRVGLTFQPYHGCVLPMNYKGKKTPYPQQKLSLRLLPSDPDLVHRPCLSKAKLLYHKFILKANPFYAFSLLRSPLKKLCNNSLHSSSKIPPS